MGAGNIGHRAVNAITYMTVVTSENQCEAEDTETRLLVRTGSRKVSQGGWLGS